VAQGGRVGARGAQQRERGAQAVAARAAAQPRERRDVGGVLPVRAGLPGQGAAAAGGAGAGGAAGGRRRCGG